MGFFLETRSVGIHLALVSTVNIERDSHCVFVPIYLFMFMVLCIKDMQCMCIAWSNTHKRESKRDAADQIHEKRRRKKKREDFHTPKSEWVNRTEVEAEQRTTVFIQPSIHSHKIPHRVEPLPTECGNAVEAGYAFLMWVWLGNLPILNLNHCVYLKLMAKYS